jgi:hypothetical protein
MMVDKTTHFLKKFYPLFASDLTRVEIERRVKVDTTSMYAFYLQYAQNIQKSDLAKRPLKRALIFGRDLFVTFLLKLTQLAA